MTRLSAKQRAADLANLTKARAALAGRRAKHRAGAATVAAPHQPHAHSLAVKKAANPVRYRKVRLRRVRIKL